MDYINKCIDDCSKTFKKYKDTHLQSIQQRINAKGALDSVRVRYKHGGKKHG